MAHKIGEDTEIQVSLKNINRNIDCCYFSCSFIFHLEERLDILEMKTNTNKIQFESYKEQPSRSHTDVEVLKKELEYIKEKINK
jgi:hypothetical protein